MRSLIWINTLAAVGLALTVCQLNAQQPSAVTPVERTALTHFAAEFRSIQNKAPVRRIVLDPVVLPWTYENGSIRRMAQSAPARSSNDAAILAQALAASIAADSELVKCPAVRGRQCQFPSPNIALVDISEPTIVGDVASLIIRTRLPYRTNGGKGHLAVGGSAYLVELVRSGAAWTVRAMKIVAES